MKNFTSFLSTQTEESIYCRKAAGNWNDSYEENLKRFDAYVTGNYPDSQALSQDMADSWCAKGETEVNNSCRSRNYVAISFLKHLKNAAVLILTFQKCPAKKCGHTFPMLLLAPNWPFFSRVRFLPSLSQQSAE